MKTPRKHLSEEHKLKISSAQKGITFEQRYGKEKANNMKKHLSNWAKQNDIRPKEIFYAKGKDHPLWKGGLGHIYARKVCIENGKDMTRCQICGDTNKKIFVHHHDGNRNNNKLQNLGVVCSFCHNSIHETGVNTRFEVGHIGYRNSGEFQQGNTPWNKGLYGYHTGGNLK